MASSSVVAMQPEIDRLAGAYGIDVAPIVATLAPFLASYLELALDDGGFEIITGGAGIGFAQPLADAAAVLGLAAPARTAFLAAAAEYPAAMLGLKVDAGGRHAPTLYHRTMLPLEDGLRLVARWLPARRAELAARLAPAHTLYGLGFTTLGAELRVKTYVLDDVAGRVGFRSVRATADGVEDDDRLYEAEAPVAATIPVAQRAANVLGVNVLGHVARSARRGTKVYVERVGAIPTDPRAR